MRLDTTDPLRDLFVFTAAVGGVIGICVLLVIVGALLEDAWHRTVAKFKRRL